MAEIHGWDALRGKQVNHHCDVRNCVNPEHLYIGTQTENHADMHRRGRAGDYKGERNGNARLTASDVAEIRRLRVQGIRQVDLAARYGVTQGHISSIILRKTW